MIPIFVKSGLIVNLVVDLVGLIVSLLSKFWRCDKTYENNHSLGQRRRMMMMTTTQASTSYQIMKVKRPREGGFCVTFSFWVLFCDGSFFPLCLCEPRKFFFLTKNLVIIYKLSTIKGFYHKVTNFSMVLVFVKHTHN